MRPVCSRDDLCTYLEWLLAAHQESGAGCMCFIKARKCTWSVSIGLKILNLERYETPSHTSQEHAGQKKGIVQSITEEPSWMFLEKVVAVLTQ